MSFIPYLNFDGNCAEAMQFYADLFGATGSADFALHGCARKRGSPTL